MISTEPLVVVPTRADDGVKAEILKQLAKRGHPSLRCIACEFDSGVLTLSGQLSNFYLKQLAQEVVSGVAQVRQVINRIEVARSPAR